MSPMAAPTLMGLFLMVSRTMASSQFVIIEQKSTYQQASDYCATVYGTTLATIRNDYDARDLLELRQDLGSDHTWVGMTMNSGEWKWDSGFKCDGDCLNIKWWDDGEPSTATSRCTIIHGNRNEIDELLHDVPCSKQYNDFACDVPVMGKRVAAVEAGLSSANSDVDAVESKMVSVESDVDVLETEMDTVQSDVDSVEDDVVSVQNAVDVLEDAMSPLAVGRYQVIVQTKTYQQASDYCKANYGTTLATIRSDDDARDLLKLQQDIGDKHVWIGLRDSGEWKWDSGFNCGGDCEDLKWWDNGQPQNRQNEDCAVMHWDRDTIDKQFHDVPCTKWTAKAFACDSPVMGPRMAAVETGLTSANSKVSAVETGLSTVTSRVSTVETEVATVNSKVSVVETGLATMQTDVDAVESLVSLLAVDRYKMIKKRTNYQKASDYCATTYGTTLATIRNDADALELLAMRKALGGDGYFTWVGLRKNAEGVWEWESGYPCDGGDCLNSGYWQDRQPASNDGCAAIHKNDNDISNLNGAPTTWSADLIACDTPFMATQIEMASLQTRLNSLERIMDGFYDTIGDEQSVSAPVGFGVYADYALYALALANLVVLLGLFAFCMVRRVPMDMAKVQYGRVYDTEMDKL